MRSFKTKRGLGVHINAKHATQRDRAVVEDINSRKNIRATDHEQQLLAEIEVSVEHRAVSGVKGKGINQLIVDEWKSKYPDSPITLDRIRNLRKKSSSYPALVAAARTARDSVNNPGPPGGSSSSSSNSSQSSSSGEEEGNDEVFPPGPDPRFVEFFEGTDVGWTGHTVEELCSLPPEAVDHLVSLTLEQVGKELTTPKGKRPKIFRPPPNENRRNRRRRLYRYTQDWFRKDPSACVKAAVAGKVGPVSSTVPAEQLQEFWGETFSANAAYEPFPTTARQIDASLDRPVQPGEVRTALRSLKNNKATGQDKVNKADLTQIGAVRLALVYNVFLITGYVPTQLRDSKVTLIPKKPEPVLPAEYRPISVFSTFLRMFHSILDARLSKVPLKSSQKGFQRRDGIAENTFILRSFMKYARKQKKDCYMAFIDLSKAFDSVSSQAIVAALKRLGVPQLLVAYVENLYRESYTDVYGKRVKLGRGIRQGDPLSTFLFNAVVDMCMDNIPEEFGYKLDDALQLCELFFADDCILFSETKAGLLRLLEFTKSRFASVGLAINAGKSSTVAYRWNGRQKKHAIDDTPFATLNGRNIPAAGPTTTLKYLGVNFTPTSFKTLDVEKDLDTALKNTRTAPLTTPQKLFALRQNIIPGLYHRLILGETTKTLLLTLDLKVRKFVREVTHLPHDVPTALFHAKVKHGGLGIPSFTTSIAYMREKRFQKLIASDCVYTQSLMEKVGRTPAPIRMNGIVCSIKEDAERSWRSALRASVDCGQLVNSEFDHRIYSWITDPGTGQSEFVKSLHVRAKALKTPSRQARRDGSRRTCRVDRAVCSLTHISQECELSHGRRVARHDKIARKIAATLRRNWLVEMEPHIPTGRSYLKPDVVAMNKTETVVLDPIVTGDNVDLRERAAQKVLKYNIPDVWNYVKEKRRLAGLPESENFSVIGVPITYRGDMLASTRLQLHRIGISTNYLSKIILGLVTDGWFLWRGWSENSRA